MRVPFHPLAVLALVSAASAQYISEGWKPGQPVVKGETGYTYQSATSTGASHAASTGFSVQGQKGEPDLKASAKNLMSMFSLEAVLESAPMQALFGRAGVNISEKLEAARSSSNIWDSRIPLLMDDNYEDTVVEEQFGTLEEERDRVWFIVISLTAAQNEGVSKYVDDQFDKAYNLTQEAGDLQHVRWGRIDYMNVTTVTTKWNVWRAPFLVVAKDRGQTLRFYRPGQIRLQAEVLREFLRRDAWEQTTPWRSAFGPGGSREFMMDYFATALTKAYDITVMIPRWLLLVISGSIASIIVNIMHNSKSLWTSSTPKTPTIKASEPKVDLASTPASPIAQATASGSKSAKGGASKRKGSKK